MVEPLDFWSGGVRVVRRGEPFVFFLLMREAYEGTLVRVCVLSHFYLGIKRKSGENQKTADDKKKSRFGLSPRRTSAMRIS